MENDLETIEQYLDAPHVFFKERNQRERGFAEVFEREIKPHLIKAQKHFREQKKLQQNRRAAYLPWVWFAGLMFVISWIPALLSSIAGIGWLAALMLPVMLVPLGVILEMARRFYAIDVFYRGLPVERVIALVLGQVGQFTFNPNVGVSKRRLAESRLTPRAKGLAQPVVLRSKYLVQGDHAGLGLEFCHLESWTPKDKDMPPRLVFRGQFISIRVPKGFPATVVAVTKEKELDPSEAARGLEPVDLESPDLNREFLVFSDDQIGARQIMTPDVMESISRVAVKYDAHGAFMCSFVGDRINLAISTRYPFFWRWTPEVPETAVSDLYRYFDETEELLDLVERVSKDFV